jgi:hypothetical protein
VYQASPLTSLAGCEVYPTAADRTAGTNKGVITVKASLHPIEHEGKKYLLAEPLEGAEAQFTTLFFKNCPTGSKAEVKGSIVLELSDVATVKQLVKPAPAELFKSDSLTYGVNAATLEGSVWAKLKGTLAGESWGVG